MFGKHQFLIATLGDPEGIGPEIALKAWQRLSAKERKQVVWVGSQAALERSNFQNVPIRVWPDTDALTKTNSDRFNLIASPHSFTQSGAIAGWSVEFATQNVLDGVFEGMVTGPIDKSRLQDAGFEFAGHTEMIADLCSKHDDHRYQPTMMLTNENLRVALVTTHCALREVSERVTVNSITRAIMNTHQALRSWWGLSHPKIAVCALNPHAGEGGIFGYEEKEVISPCLDELKNQIDAEITGPHPADTLFATLGQKKADAVIAMYHDQGLIPAKQLDFDHMVNITLGIPIIRSSVDHGVGMDIAGQNRANPSSLISAIRLALKLKESRHERQYTPIQNQPSYL